MRQEPKAASFFRSIAHRLGGAKRYTRLQWLRLLRIRAEPEAIARGMAIGVFVGCIPFMPSQIVLAVLVAFLLKASKLAATLGTLLSNPVTFMPMYALFYLIGRELMPFEVPELDLGRMSPSLLADAGWRLVVTMISGGALLGLPLALAAYFLTLYAVRLYHAKRRKQRETSSS